jgi:peptidoglycan/xylan/chitin deacetylase (PgdA/CDA1 family)
MKPLIKHTICSTLYRSGMLHLYIEKVLRKRRVFPAVIINYHRLIRNLDSILETEPTVNHLIDDFAKEIRFLKRYFDILPLDQVTETLKNSENFKKPTLAITADDGYKNNFELLFPVLKEHNIPVTIFLTSGFTGTNNKIWVDRLEHLFLNTKKIIFNSGGIFKERKYLLSTLKQKRQAYLEILYKLKDTEIKLRNRCLAEIEEKLGPVHDGSPIMLNWEEVRKMQKSNISFGAHTLTHPILTNMPLEDAKREIAESKRIIEKNLGTKVNHFAYPNGRPQDFNEELRQFCKDIGFESISSYDFGNNCKPSDIWSLKRIGSCLPFSVFAVNLARAFSIKTKKYKNSRSLN